VATALIAVVVADQPEKMDGTLDADQVPSLFGYDAASARALLEGLGLRVTEEQVAYCDLEGRVVGTSPRTGARFAPGHAITIHTAVPSDPSCSASYVDRAAAWEFVDFANGRGPAPRFSDRVAIVVDGSHPATLTGAEAADPESWGGFSPLSELSKASARVAYQGGTSYATPVLSVQYQLPPPQTCGVSRPRGSGQRLALVVSIALDTDDPAGCPPVVDLYRSSGGIDTIVLYSAKTAAERGPSVLSPPPWVTGHS
jgi:hypothetical protein